VLQLVHEAVLEQPLLTYTDLLHTPLLLQSQPNQPQLTHVQQSHVAPPGHCEFWPSSQVYPEPHVYVCD
jgi:hypothetical protein